MAKKMTREEVLRKALAKVYEIYYAENAAKIRAAKTK